MNRIVFLIAISLMLPALVHAQRKRAWMMGISCYHSHGYCVWNNIHGAEDIAFLAPELKKKGFSVQALINEQATYHAILCSLDSFVQKSSKGDVVYLHFSCHGQPVEDGMLGDTKDEKDGWDESLVPIDAGKEYNANGYQGDKHITDDTLNMYFNRLRKRIGPKGMLYVAMDACHAGTMSRRGVETVRGTNEGLSKAGTKYWPPKETVRHFSVAKSADMAPALFIEACLSRERNTEIRVNGKDYGALSYNIGQALKSLPSLDKKTKAQFKACIEAASKVKGQWPRTQTLVFEE